MTVTKTWQGSVMTLTGTPDEVAQALSDEQVPGGKIISVDYNGTNTTAQYFAVRNKNIVKTNIASKTNII